MMKSIEESSKKVPTYHIIREVYDSSNAHQHFEAELDKALEAKVDYIIIEPPRLGDETGRWITVGNCLHKTAVLTGFASLISSMLWHERPVISGPMCAVSLFCTGLYTVSWNYDPCCQYQQVENDEEVLNRLPLAEVSSPVILSYTPNIRKNIYIAVLLYYRQHFVHGKYGVRISSGVYYGFIVRAFQTMLNKNKIKKLKKVELSYEVEDEKDDIITT